MATLIKPPGIKRLLVVCSAIAYVILGLPIWWATTSLHRPPLPHHEIAAALSEAKSRSALLPVALRVVLIAPAGQQLPDALSAAALLHTLQAAVQNTHTSEAPLLLATTVVTASQCIHATASGTQQQQQHLHSCPNLSAAPVSASSRLTDAWLEQQLSAAAAAGATESQHAAAATPGQYTLLLLPGNGSSSGSGSSNGTVIVGRHRHAWMMYDSTAAQQPQQLLPAVAAAAVRALSCCFALHSSTAALTAAEHLPISAAGHTQLSFSLLNADISQESRHCSWDFEHFAEKYLARITASLAPVCRTSVESQVLHFTPARQQGKWSRKHDAFVVKQSQLQFFIDSEWAVESGRAVMQVPLGSSSSGLAAAAAAAPGELYQSGMLEPHVLHFLVYVPARTYSPLLLLGPKGQQRDSNSFWIPSWGGLMVLNKGNETAEQQCASSSTNTSTSSGSSTDQVVDQEISRSLQQDQHVDNTVTAGTADSSSDGSSSSSASCAEHSDWLPVLLQEHDYQQVAAVVIAQLQALFGVAPDADHSSSSSSSSRLSGSRLQQLPAGATGFTEWQIDALVRQRAGADVLEAARVLASLSKLVLELPNLEMPDLIGQQVAQALTDIKLAWQHIAAADYHAASAAAAAARAAAEAAFLHPSVLAQLNFPESHKLGVYMPLFLPVSVPLLQGLVAQVVHYVKRWREYRAAQLRQRQT